MIERILESDLIPDENKKEFERGVNFVDSALDELEIEGCIPGFYDKISVYDFRLAVCALLENEEIYDKLSDDDYDGLTDGIMLIDNALDIEGIENEALDCFCSKMSLSQVLYALQWHINQAC